MQIDRGREEMRCDEARSPRASARGGSIPRRALAQLQKFLPPSLVARRAALRRHFRRQPLCASPLAARA
eukprot:1217851-Prymnesium_polylepis.1